MFEKEAEEYAGNREVCDLLDAISEDLQNYDYGTVAHYNIDPLVEKAFKDGAEFGYNKANEWHYVKDGDLPKVGVQVLSEQGTLVIYKGEGFNWVEYSPNADNIKLRKWEEPIAWKEIVLPELKEIKEND